MTFDINLTLVQLCIIIYKMACQTKETYNHLFDNLTFKKPHIIIQHGRFNRKYINDSLKHTFAVISNAIKLC